MTELAIDSLEPVDIQHVDRGWRAIAQEPRNFGLDLLHESPPIQRRRQRIGSREPLHLDLHIASTRDPGLQLGFVPLGL